MSDIKSRCDTEGPCSRQQMYTMVSDEEQGYLLDDNGCCVYCGVDLLKIFTDPETLFDMGDMGDGELAEDEDNHIDNDPEYLH